MLLGLFRFFGFLRRSRRFGGLRHLGSFVSSPDGERRETADTKHGAANENEPDPPLGGGPSAILKRKTGHFLVRQNGKLGGLITQLDGFPSRVGALLRMNFKRC